MYLVHVPHKTLVEIEYYMGVISQEVTLTNEWEFLEGDLDKVTLGSCKYNTWTYKKDLEQNVCTRK